MSEQKTKAPVITVTGVLAFLIGIMGISLAVLSLRFPVLIIAGMACIILSSSLKAFNKGVGAQLFSLTRFFGSIALGYIFHAQAGAFLGLGGLGATVAGFYLIFFSVFIGLTILFSLVFKKGRPSIHAKLLGGLVGFFEGIIISWFVFISLTLIPGSKLSEYNPELIKALTGSTEKMLAPLLPTEANDAINAIKVARQLSHQLDPKKVDINKIQQTLEPISGLPQVIAIQQNPKTQAMIKERDFKGLMSSKEFQNLISSPEVQEAIKQIDWVELQKALSIPPEQTLIPDQN